MATKTLNIALDDQLIKQIDRTVKKEMGSRSEYFRRLALADLERRQSWTAVFDASNELGKRLDLTEEKVSQLLEEYKLDR